jgi:lipopolysaccharide export system permease protein
MKTLRRYIYREIFAAVAVVSLAFLALFSFFDLLDELTSIGKVSPLDASAIYQLRHAVTYVLLLVPNHLYELLPISVLIGSVFVFARLAQGSEYTILRTSGLGPWRALGLMLGLGSVFVVLTFALGDYVAPVSDKAAQFLKARYDGQIYLGQSGAWLKERQTHSQFSVNVRAISPQGELQDIRLFEFDDQGKLLSRTQAQGGHVGEAGDWALTQVVRTTFDTRQTSHAHIDQQQLPTWTWPTGLTAEMVAVALLKPERMRTFDLYTYIQHLDANGQSAQRYELEFWRKVFYPLSCLVMMVLALPFAYLHFRSGGITGYVFMGVMIGISFFLLNNVFGYVGRLNDWRPWLAAASPSMIYSVMSLSAFVWLVLRR